MSNAPEGWTCVVTFLLLDACGEKVFCKREAHGPALPDIERAGDDFEPHDVVRSFSATYALEVRTLRDLHEFRDEVKQRLDVMLLVEMVSEFAAPGGGLHAVPAEEIATMMGLSGPMLAAAMTAASEARSGDYPPHRRPWAKPGWHAKPERWIGESATRLGIRLTGPVEDFRTWSLSRILRVPSDKGYLYFKTSAGSRLFAREAVLMAGLAARFPDHVPAPLAINAEENWMLCADFGTPIARGEVERTAAAFAQFGELQVATARRTGELLGLGCQDRSLPVLLRNFSDAVASETAVAFLSQAERVDVQLAPLRLARCCELLAGYRVPLEALVHGDLHRGNIAHKAVDGRDRYLVFDWTDACIAHPFLDLIVFHHISDEGVAERLKAAYLGAWTGYEPMPRLKEVLSLTLPLSAAHQVVSYGAIDQASETPHLFGDEPFQTFWLRRVLATLPA